MKGYLQRMAASVVRPKHGIHPLVGSIYAGSAFTGTPRDAGTEPGLHESSLQEDGRLMTSPQIGGVATGSLATGDAASLGPNAKNEAAQRRSGARPGEDLRPEGRVDRQRTPSRPLLSKADMEGGEERSPKSAWDTGSPERYDAGFDGEAGEALRTREFNQGRLLPRVKPEAAPRSAPAEREPDKVEIHIGRIEVTAVPQEAPRPAATRPRKSLDLSEYLKRRDGRAG
jgi:hypothetical protein